MTSHYVWERIAGRDPDLRAADADRERIADRLRASHAEGRIDLGEFQERLERCYESRTVGELDALVRDLPQSEELDRRPAVRPSVAGRLARMPLVPILITLIVVSAAVGHRGFFWLWIPLVVLFWRTTGWRHRRRPVGGPWSHR